MRRNGQRWRAQGLKCRSFYPSCLHVRLGTTGLRITVRSNTAQAKPGSSKTLQPEELCFMSLRFMHYIFIHSPLFLLNKNWLNIGKHYCWEGHHNNCISVVQTSTKSETFILKVPAAQGHFWPKIKRGEHIHVCN